MVKGQPGNTRVPFLFDGNYSFTEKTVVMGNGFFESLPSCPDAYGGDTERYLEMMDEPVEDSNNEGEIKASTKEQVNKDAWAAFLEMRAAAAEAGLQDMTLDKINAEIQETRNGR